MTARLLELSSADYFADKVEKSPTLSYSTAATLITQSPMHAHLEHPRLGGRAREQTASMATGTIIHALLLEDDPSKVIRELPFDDFRKKAAQDQRDEAIAAGVTPLTTQRYAELSGAAAAIRGRLAKLGVALTGKREVGVAWSEGGVLCRGRLDHLEPTTGQIDELKTTTVAPPEAIMRRIVDRGYDIQFAAYSSAVSKLLPELAGRVKFRFLFCETEPPYAVTPIVFGGMFREFGNRRWGRAVRSWARCLREGHWPGYAEESLSLEPLPWQFEREMETP